MSSTRSTGTDRIALGWYVMTVLWFVAGTAFSISTVRAANTDARPLVDTAMGVGVLAVAVGTWGTLRSGNGRWLAIGLIVSGLAMPTGFAIALNIVPIAGGVILAVRSRPPH